MSVIHVPPGVHVLAMDVHKSTISAAVLAPDVLSPVVDKISSDEQSVRRLVARFEEPGRVWACYEAGPTGYELARLMRSFGVRCEVIAPSLIPARPGDRVKTGLPRWEVTSDVWCREALLKGCLPCLRCS